MAANKGLQFGPFDRLISVNFPSKIKVYWVWAAGGTTAYKDAFPGPATWTDKFGSVSRVTAAPWFMPSNKFGETRNAVSRTSLSTFMGISDAGKYTRPASFLFHRVLENRTINEQASRTKGGFFLKSDEAVQFANNIATKAMFHVDYASKHSWSYPWFFSNGLAPAIYDLPLPTPPGGTLGTVQMFSDDSIWAYMIPPKKQFTKLEIWETDWPSGKPHGPVDNGTIAQLEFVVGLVNASSQGLPPPGPGESEPPPKYAIFANGQQLTDYFNTERDALTAKTAMQEADRNRRKVFFPFDHFPEKFKYNQKLVGTIPITGPGINEGIQKPPFLPKACTHPPSISPVGGFADVTDSCGRKVPTLLGLGTGFDTGPFHADKGIEGTPNAGFGPYIGNNFTGLVRA